MPQTARTLFEKVFLILLVLILVVHVAFHLHPFIADKKMPWLVITPVFFTFSFLHACFVLGWRRAVAFLGITTVVTFSAEYIGTTTGLLFGSYTYNPVVGYLIFGEVPFTIPMAWFTMLYASYVVVNLAIDGRPVSRSRKLGRILWLSFVGALIMTAWDLTLDPYMVEFEKGWVWHDGGPYFGIPYSNFTGWVGVSFVVMFLYRLVELKVEQLPLGHINRWVVVMPVATYGLMSISDLAIGQPEATLLISPFAMGIPCLIAASRLIGWRVQKVKTGDT